MTDIEPFNKLITRYRRTQNMSEADLAACVVRQQALQQTVNLQRFINWQQGLEPLPSQAMFDALQHILITSNKRLSSDQRQEQQRAFAETYRAASTADHSAEREVRRRQFGGLLLEHRANLGHSENGMIRPLNRLAEQNLLQSYNGEYVAKLEDGELVPSSDWVDTLSRALQLTDEDRAALFAAHQAMETAKKDLAKTPTPLFVERIVKKGPGRGFLTGVIQGGGEAPPEGEEAASLTENGASHAAPDLDTIAGSLKPPVVLVQRIKQGQLPNLAAMRQLEQAHMGKETEASYRHLEDIVIGKRLEHIQKRMRGKFWDASAINDVAQFPPRYWQAAFRQLATPSEPKADGAAPAWVANIAPITHKAHYLRALRHACGLSVEQVVQMSPSPIPKTTIMAIENENNISNSAACESLTALLCFYQSQQAISGAALFNQEVFDALLPALERNGKGYYLEARQGAVGRAVDTPARR